MSKRMELTLTIKILDEKLFAQEEEINKNNKELNENAAKLMELTQNLDETKKALERALAERDGNKKDLEELRKLNEQLNKELMAAKATIAE